MKNFIKTLFAVIFGNFIFYGMFFLLLILFAIGIANSSSEKKMVIADNTVIQLKISGGLSDMSENKEFQFGKNRDNDMSSHSIHDIIGGIQKAKNDEKVKALWITMNGNMDLSYAQVEILRKAISDFQSSKKPVYAYGEVVSQKMYYLSSLADKVYVNPHGGLDIRGFGAQLQFFKNTLNKLEIEPQIFYAGKFKSATEPFRLDKMSEENKTQTKELLTDISENVIHNIAQDRGISSTEINSAINQMLTVIPQNAAENKFIDGLKYVDQVETELKEKLNVATNERLSYTTMDDYITDNTMDDKSGEIAVYVAEGDIIDGKSQEGSIGSSSMVKDLRAMADDESIKGVVIRVNSPGGSALASAVILREIELLKKKKPVVVSMGNVAASGGYYISSGANRIFAEPNTITGSIGVFGIIPNIGKLMTNKFGITFDEVELNDHAVMGINKNFDAVEAQKMQMEIENIYATFKGVVSKGRNIQVDSVESIAQGRVWSGKRALSLKLVDELGGLQEAIQYTSSLTKSKKSSYYFYNKRKSPLELFFDDLSGEAMMNYIQAKWLYSRLGEYTHYLDALEKFKSLKGAQARMMYEVKI